MAYSDFDVPTVEAQFQVQVIPGTVFGPLIPAPPPGWLTDLLARGNQLRLASEKARNEFIVAPILLTVRELSKNAVAIFSGERFDVDSAAGLGGECDFLLTLSAPVPIIRAPVFFVVEAKKQDIEGGLGQCAAQMIAARRFNLRNGKPAARAYGCVTTGEVWQFLRLDDQVVTYDTFRFFLDDVGLILAAFLHAVTENVAIMATPAA